MNPPLHFHNAESAAALGHALRGPLGAISAAAEVLKQLSARMEVKNPQDAELMARTQAVIARQTEQLTWMIDDLLRSQMPATPR